VADIIKLSVAGHQDNGTRAHGKRTQALFDWAQSVLAQLGLVEAISPFVHADYSAHQTTSFPQAHQVWWPRRLCPLVVRHRRAMGERVDDCATRQRACAVSKAAPGRARSRARTIHAERGESVKTS
jgi:hypothetical protein